MTLFALLLDLCGLSVQEAADHLGCSKRQVEDFKRGSRLKQDGSLRGVTCPPGVEAEMWDLWRRMDRAAAEGADAIRDAAIKDVELAVATTDDEAQERGLPSARAHGRLIALTLGRIGPEHRVRVVPVASTPATVAAADAYRIGRAARHAQRARVA